MLHLNDVTLRIGGRLLLEHASVHLPAGQRIGLVGANGSGKTSLLRLILGELSPDAGEVRLRRHARVGWVAQEAPGGERTPRQAVLDADRERAALLHAAETASDPGAIAEAQTRLADIGAHAAPARASAILAGPRLRRGGAAAAARQLLRRLAHAHSTRRRAVRRARSAAPGRADQSPRSRGEPVARGLPPALSEDPAPGQPRPRSLEPGARAHRASRSAEAHELRRRLRRLRAHPAREAGAPGQGAREDRGAAPAHAGVRRPLPLQGEQGAPGAEPAQGDRQAGADPGGDRGAARGAALS